MEKDEFFGSHSCLNWPDSGVLPAKHWFQCGFSSPAAPNSGDISIDSHASVEINLKKRKAASTKGMGKEASLSSTFTEDESKIAEEEDGNAKRSKSEELRDAKLQDNPKDYIHVKARRGQATDSHSLAERVRREKISKRMKFLQDLVPGCSKVTGKAVMLDEIINYVQSLQRQVEFLSIKLATVNPRTQEFSMESFLPNDIPTYSLESAMPATYAYAYQSQQLNHLQNQNGRDGNALEVECSVTTSNFGVHLDGFVDNATQIANYFEDDLQNVVQNLQIGLGQSQNAAVYGLHHTDHMRI